MSIVKALAATTHVDSHGDRFTKECLQDMVEQTKKSYVRVIHEHDPRKIPLGRVIDAKLIQLEDGNYGVENTIEIYDGKETAIDDPNKILKIESEEATDNLSIHFDYSYSKKEFVDRISELNSSLKKHSNLSYFGKKSLEPLSVLTLAGVYVVGKIFEGFLNKVGENAYITLKDKLFDILQTQKDKDERVLQFSLDIKKDDVMYRTNVFITNPNKEDIETVLKYGFKTLDNELIKYLRPDIKEIDINYNSVKRNFEVTYMLNGKAKVLIPTDEFKIIDILV